MYTPDSEGFRVVFFCVPRSIMTTVAPGTTAPFGSKTVPLIPPWLLWAKTANEHTRTPTTALTSRISNAPFSFQKPQKDGIGGVICVLCFVLCTLCLALCFQLCSSAPSLETSQQSSKL